MTTSPTGRPSALSSIPAWYECVERELHQNNYRGPEAKKFRDYYVDAGLLTWRKRPYFFEHFGRTFEEAVDFLFERSPQPAVLDLGCGAGTQSLYFAARGARVVAMDLDEGALRLLRERIDFYQKELNRTLDIQIVVGDALAYDYDQLPPFDGIYSMFAFNMMQPSLQLLDCLVPRMAPDGRMAILDGNWSYWANGLLRPSRTDRLRPQEMVRAIETRGMRVVSSRMCMALPPLFWRFLPRPLTASLNRALCVSGQFSVSYQLLGEKPS